VSPERDRRCDQRSAEIIVIIIIDPAIQSPSSVVECTEKKIDASATYQKYIFISLK